MIRLYIFPMIGLLCSCTVSADIDKPKSREKLIEILKNDYTIRGNT